MRNAGSIALVVGLLAMGACGGRSSESPAPSEQPTGGTSSGGRGGTNTGADGGTVFTGGGPPTTGGNGGTGIGAEGGTVFTGGTGPTPAGGNGGGGEAGASCIPSCPEGDTQVKDANSCPGGWTCVPRQSCGTIIYCTWWCESFLITCDPGDERIEGECPSGSTCYEIFGCGNRYNCVVGGQEPTGEGGAAGAAGAGP